MQITGLNILKKKKIFFFLSLISIIGFLLRVYRLDRTSLWFDELSTLGRITSPLSQIINGSATLPFPPLYYILMHYWVKLFGISEFSLRFPSVLFSVFSIILIFELAKELFDRKVGLLAALLLSVSLYSIDFAREAKMYSMLWFFGLLSFYFFYKFTRGNKTRDLALYVLSTLTAIYTLYAGFLFIIAQNFIFFLLFFKRAQLKKWLAAQAIIALLYLPWPGIFISTMMNRRGVGGIGWIPKDIDYLQFFLCLFAATTGITMRFISRWSILALIICLYLFLLFSAFLRNAKKGEQIANFTKNRYLLLAWIFIPIAGLYLVHIFILPVLISRYLGLIHIPLIIFFSIGLSRYSPKIKYVLATLLLYLVFTYQLYPYYKSNLKLCILPQQNWRSLLRQINAEKGDHALVAFSDAFSSRSEYLFIKYCYFSKGIKYYNHNREIPILTRKELEKSIRDKQYDSVFLIYYTVPDIEGSIDGYRLEKKVKKGVIDYLWFKKRIDAAG